MKEFLIYTGMRLGLFVSTAFIVFGIWFLIAGSVELLWVIVIAFIISGITSYRLLDRQRTAFAERVSGRADRISEKYEEMRSKEDEG